MSTFPKVALLPVDSFETCGYLGRVRVGDVVSWVLTHHGSEPSAAYRARRFTRQPAAGDPVTPLERTVLITGASSGIGRACALKLADRGADLVLASRSPEALADVAKLCRDRGTTVTSVVTDVSDADAVDAAIRAAAATSPRGRVDAVVHSAVALSYGRFDEVPAEVFDRALATTLTGTANVARSSLAAFNRQGGRGRLVVIGSLLGKVSVPYMSSYVTAKWGVHGLVRALQIEARETPGIEISLVSPGGVDTPVYRQAGTYLTRHGRPPPPVDPPEKVADAVLSVLRRPQRDKGVGPANPILVAGFRLVPAVFDRVVAPLFRRGALSGSGVSPTSGNVLEPNPAGETLRGGWTRWGGERSIDS